MQLHAGEQLDGGEALETRGKPEQAARMPDHVALLRELGSCSGIIAPLIADERILGALSFGSSRKYCESELGLAEEVASRCARAIVNARAYLLAREAIELRDTFVATISHDLKNPLATISGQAQLLLRSASPDDQRLRQGLKRIESMIERMSRMIDGLIDVTLLELGGRLEIRRGRMDLADLARRVVAEHQERAPRHRIQLAGDSELIGEWDLARMERVLDNLVGNAVKYSPDGGVVTVICVREADEAGAWAILSVRDEGVGIPAADVARIFERFHRAENVGVIGGTGIGLSTIRDIVEQHSGTITVDSREGRGSSFTIRLPIC